MANGSKLAATMIKALVHPRKSLIVLSHLHSNDRLIYPQQIRSMQTRQADVSMSQRRKEDPFSQVLVDWSRFRPKRQLPQLWGFPWRWESRCRFPDDTPAWHLAFQEFNGEVMVGFWKGKLESLQFSSPWNGFLRTGTTSNTTEVSTDLFRKVSQMYSLSQKPSYSLNFVSLCFTL